MKAKQPKIDDEKTYRRKLLNTARALGCEGDLKMIFDKYDTLMRSCTNQKELEAIKLMGVLEVAHLLNDQGTFASVNGQNIKVK